MLKYVVEPHDQNDKEYNEGEGADDNNEEGESSFFFGLFMKIELSK